MCGICGELSFGAATVDEPAVAAMAASLCHRGPDHGATFVGESGGVGRLAEIDSGDYGAEP